MRMRTALGLALAAGCSAQNFFQYREDTGLYVIERPKGFSTMFGAELAATSTPDDDWLAVSAGPRSRTAVFRLASLGELAEVEDPADTLPPGDKSDSIGKAELYGHGAALAGLPQWSSAKGQGLSKPFSGQGCVAVGEPAEVAGAHSPRVVVHCASPAKDIDITSNGKVSGFGRKLAAIRPSESGAFLLAIASEKDAAVWSGVIPSRAFAPQKAQGKGTLEAIAEITAGRLADGRIFVAAGAFADDDTSAPGRVYVFVQAAQDSAQFEQAACLERAREPGFGGEMIAADLDGAGGDELIISAALVPDRKDAVYVYDPAQLNVDLGDANQRFACGGNGKALKTEISPGEGPLDVQCSRDCYFGTALAAGDIATDGKAFSNELIVGAPNAKVDGTSGAGAVYVYRGSELTKGKADVAGQVADSWPESDAYFGGGLAVAPMAGRAELIVGATGKGQVYVAFCTGTGEDIDKGADTTRDASGDVVSTRCRL